MESPSRTLTLSPPPPPHHLLITTTRRRRSNGGDSAISTEFEFSNTGSNSQTTLHTADELFSHGFLLPLQLLHLNRSDHLTPEPDTGPLELEPGLIEPDTGPLEHEPGSIEPDPHASPLITSSGSISKRWRQIFNRPEKKPDNNIAKPEKTKDKGKLNNNNNNNNNTELNINIWPFSRSKSAGNSRTGTNKPAVQMNRKVSSAPCSRSNSSKKSWPSSPGRPGVHLSRSSPVWHIKKSGPNRGGSGNKGRVLRLNVPVCIGYGQNMSCRSDESGGFNKSGERVDSGSNGNLFSLRGLFSRKSNSSTSTELTV